MPLVTMPAAFSSLGALRPSSGADGAGLIPADPRCRRISEPESALGSGLRHPRLAGELLQALAAGAGVALVARDFGARDGAAALLLLGLNVAQAASAHGFTIPEIR